MSDIELKVKEIQDSAIEALKNADGLEKLNEIRVSFLGKKGSLTQVLKSMKTVAPEDRPKAPLMRIPKSERFLLTDLRNM